MHISNRALEWLGRQRTSLASIGRASVQSAWAKQREATASHLRWRHHWLAVSVSEARRYDLSGIPLVGAWAVNKRLSWQATNRKSPILTGIYTEYIASDC